MEYDFTKMTVTGHPVERAQVPLIELITELTGVMIRNPGCIEFSIDQETVATLFIQDADLWATLMARMGVPS